MDSMRALEFGVIDKVRRRRSCMQSVLKNAQIAEGHLGS